MGSFFLNFFPFFFLAGIFFFVLCLTPLLALGKFRAKELIQSNSPPLLFYYFILKRLFLKQEWDNLYFSLSLSKHIAELCYAVSAVGFLAENIPWFHEALANPYESLTHLTWAGCLIIALSLLIDFIAHLLASFWPIAALKVSAFFASCYLTL